jgi:hypothetical protein
MYDEGESDERITHLNGEFQGIHQAKLTLIRQM